MKATYDPEEKTPHIPMPGSQGEAWPAGGCADPTSAEYGAWLFQPEGDENAYYVSADELIFSTPNA